MFDRQYVVAATPVAYVDHHTRHGEFGTVEHLAARLVVNGDETDPTGAGNGPVDAFVRTLRDGLRLDIHFQSYHEQAWATAKMQLL